MLLTPTVPLDQTLCGDGPNAIGQHLPTGCTIHTFGYGADHDANVRSFLSLLHLDRHLVIIIAPSVVVAGDLTERPLPGAMQAG